MKYYLSRADPSVRARAWAGVVLPPIPRRLYVAPLHGILYRPVAIHSHFLLIQTLRQVVLGIARLPRVRASRLAEVVSLDVDRELAKRRGRRVADVAITILPVDSRAPDIGDPRSIVQVLTKTCETRRPGRYGRRLTKVDDKLTSLESLLPLALATQRRQRASLR